MENSSLITQQVAGIALMQIKQGVSQSVYWSWGVTDLMYKTYDNKHTLAMKVNGLIHKGWVYVCLNEATDTYTIYLINSKGKEKKKVEDVYCDVLGDTIDKLIEKPAGLSERRYRRLVEEETRRILNLKSKRDEKREDKRKRKSVG